jgi:hypothetical protein
MAPVAKVRLQIAILIIYVIFVGDSQTYYEGKLRYLAHTQNRKQCGFDLWIETITQFFDPPLHSKWGGSPDLILSP